MPLHTSEESNELHQNSHLQATGNLAYSSCVAPHWATGFESPSSKADRISRYKRFFCVRYPRYAPIMVGRSGGALALAGFFATGLSTLLRLATSFESEERGSKELSKEATAMVATAHTHPKFIWRFYSPRTHRRNTVVASTEAEARSRLRNPSCLFSARIRITEGVYQVLAHLHSSTGEGHSFLLPDLFADHQQAERLASAATFNFSFPGHTGKVTCEVVEVRHA